MAKVCQLFSGSSGNSIYIQSKGHAFLVDIGVSAKKCEDGLKAIGVEPDSIEAIFVTHEHSDHCKGIRVFASKHSVPVWAPKKCIDEMLLNDIINDSVTVFETKKCMKLNDIDVITFAQSHDSADCVGYRFNLSDNRAVSVCTDTGYITDDARKELMGTDLIFIESNHETSMVETGPYPYPLKKRILGATGHLSNFACGEFMKELAKNGTTRFVLSHLSRENNMPHIAEQTAIAALSEIELTRDTDYRLYVSPPENTGRSIVL